MKLLPLVVPFLLLCLPSCVTFEGADLTRYGKEENFPVTTEELPADAAPVGLVAVQQDGFYLLGVVPVVKISLQRCLDHLVRKARLLGADGVCDVRFKVQPADALKFSVFPIPDWGAVINVSGTAYKRRGAHEHPSK